MVVSAWLRLVRHFYEGFFKLTIFLRFSYFHFFFVYLSMYLMIINLFINKFIYLSFIRDLSSNKIYSLPEKVFSNLKITLEL